jgi:virulence-associated protein VapD
MSSKPVVHTRDKKDALEAIKDFMMDTKGRVFLTETQETQYKRIRAAWTMLINFQSPSQVATLLEEDFGISDRQAKRDVQDAMLLYGDTTQTDKQASRLIATEMAMITFQRAAEKNDYNAMNQAVKNLIKVNGLDKEDPDRPDFNKLQGSIYVQALDEQSQTALRRMMAKPGSLDFNKVDIQDVEHEDIAG